jgi:predicted TIM-barrel fold metal-dependent hydrolase
VSSSTTPSHDRLETSTDADRADVVDAYLHCGQSHYEPWETVLAVHRQHGVRGGVMVQHLAEPDPSYLLECSRSMPSEYRAVALLGGASWREDLDRLAQEPTFAGFRVDASDPRLPAMAAAVGVFDRPLSAVLLMHDGPSAAVGPLSDVASAFPAVTLFIPHFGAAPLTASTVGAFERLASRPNIVVGISGLSIRHTFPYTETVDAVRRLLDAFGPNRVMWGSNYSYDADLGRDLDYARSDPWGIGQERVRLLLHDNARRLFFGSD